MNGGIRTVSQALELIQNHGLEGCMIGRGAYDDPW
jgi:tRNA-dihydrouridine synthase